MKSTDTSEFELAGRKFTLPCLPFSKNRIVVPSACTGLNALNEFNKNKTPLRITDMDHIYLAVFEAVNFIDEKVDRKTFDSWGINMQEMAFALTQIAKQSGILMKAEGGVNSASKEG